MTIKDKHPLDISIAEYVEIAESNGLDWLIHGGPDKTTEVKLAKKDEQEFCVEVEDDRSPNIAFYTALIKVGIK